MFKLVLEKAEEPDIKLPISAGSSKKQESSRKTSISALLTTPKPLTVDHSKLWKILKEMGIPDHLTCLLRNLYTGQEATVRNGHEQQTGSKQEKEYVKAVYCHPAYLTYMQSTSCKVLGWMKHKLESRLPAEISITSDMQMTPPLLLESEEELKSLLMKVKEESEKACLKLNILKMKVMASSPITSQKIDEETVETMAEFILGGYKITADVIVAMKLKDPYSLERKL